MSERGQGLSLPIRQHSPLPANYTSGHCEVARHGTCRGSYAGTTCTCPCHTTRDMDLLTEIANGLAGLVTDPAAEVTEALTVVRHCATCTCGAAA